MTQEDLLKRLQEAGSPAELEALSGEIEAAAFDAPKAVVHQWATGDKSSSSKADSVVLDLEELSITPMLGEFDAADLSWRYRFLESSVDLLLQLRKRLLFKLDQLFGREAEAAAPSWVAADMSGAAPLRECDVAYLCVRRLAGVAGGRDDGFSTDSEFVALDAGQRKAEILAWRRGRNWAAMCGVEFGPDPE